MKIKIKLFNGQKMPEIIRCGDWIDVFANQDIEIKGPRIENYKTRSGAEKQKIVIDNAMIPLGFSAELPKGFEGQLLPRSSTYKKTKTILANSTGIIDGVTTKDSVGYNGDNDQWFYNAIALNTCHIKKGDKIGQFRIQLSQKATAWQKLRWLFSSKIELVQVDHLGNEDRGGFGSTDTKETK